MLIVGELINTSRKAIKAAVEERNSGLIQDIARRQVAAGAHYVDVNCGTMIYNEPETMQWLMETIQAAVTAPLCLDTPNPRAMEVGLALAQQGQPMINSISAEKERWRAFLPLVLKYKARIIALCMDNRGMPETAADRKSIIQQLVADLTASGVAADDIYLDPLVKPISTSDGAGREVLETLHFIRQEYPAVHIICGVSNVSYGLPHRRVLNQVFLIQTMTAGMDAYILEPLDKTDDLQPGASSKTLPAITGAVTKIDAPGDTFPPLF